MERVGRRENELCGAVNVRLAKPEICCTRGRRQAAQLRSNAQTIAAIPEKQIGRISDRKSA
jgi:hypothetical protein